MSDDEELRRALIDAHAQLLERDSRIRGLEHEVAALRQHLDGVLATRAWRAAEHLRRIRSLVTRG